jgi:hypothetical protein
MAEAIMQRKIGLLLTHFEITRAIIVKMTFNNSLVTLYVNKDGMQ